MTKGINIKVPDTLRTRADTCARLVGATMPEFVREAIRDKCEAVERLAGQQARAAKMASQASQE